MGHPFRALFGVFTAPGTTGPLRVSGAAAPGYRSLGPNDNGRTLTVSIVDGENWEVRTGCVYTHVNRTLTRGTLDSSSTGAALNLSAACVVSVEEFSVTQAAAAPSLVAPYGNSVGVGVQHHAGAYMQTLGVSAGIAACIAAACASGGTAYIPNGDWTVSANTIAAALDDVLPKDSNGNVLAGANTWQGGGIRIVGESPRHTILRSQGGTMLSFTANFSSFCELRNLTLIGPGKATAGSVALDFNISPQLAMKNVYIRDFETGMQFYDCTGANVHNVHVRYCGTGVRFGYNGDCLNFTNCCITNNDLNVLVGWQTGAYTGAIQDCGQITFVSSLLSYATLGLKVTDTQATGLLFLGGYFEGNTKEMEIGVSGRTDGPGASMLFDGVTFAPKVSVTPIGVEIFGRPAVRFSRCRSDGDNQYTVFCKIADSNGTRVAFDDDKIVCVSGLLQVGTRVYTNTAEYREDIAYSGQRTELIDYGYFPNKPARQVIVYNTSGVKTIQQWEKNTTGGVQAGGIKIEMRDGGNMAMTGLGGSGNWGFLAATLVDALPTASAVYDGALMRLAATGAAPAKLYVCLAATNSASYSWVQLATG